MDNNVVRSETENETFENFEILKGENNETAECDLKHNDVFSKIVEIPCDLIVSIEPHCDHLFFNDKFLQCMNSFWNKTVLEKTRFRNLLKIHLFGFDFRFTNC